MFRKSYRRLVRCPIFAEPFIERAERLVMDKAEDQARERGYASVEVTIEAEDVEDPQRLVVFVTFTAEEETRAPEWSLLTKEVMWAKKKWGEAPAESPRMEEPKIEEPQEPKIEEPKIEEKPKAAPAPAEPEADDPILDTDPVEEKDDDDRSTGLGGGGSAIEMPDTSDPVDTHEEPVEEPPKQSRAKELYDQIRQRRGIPPVEFVPAPAEPDRQAEEEEPEDESPSSGKGSGGVSTTNLIGLTLGTGLVCWSLWDILG